MAYAITLRLNSAAASWVVAMWNQLAALGMSDDAIQVGYPPHLTLAVFPDDADPDRLRAAARDAAAGWRPLTISLASLGLFPGTPAGIFLAPVVTTELLTVHAGLLSALAGEKVDPHYQPGRWVPHVTLAKDLTDPPAAVAVVLSARLPITAGLDTMEVVRFRPVQVLASHRLLAT
jgi:2'-5' RNA ligase